ncbi:MAG: DNA-directed RNA polymerase subunit N [Candidatus Woesearchaeota archaeon]
MMFPIRCQATGKPIGHLWEEYNERVNNKGEDAEKVLDEFGITNFATRSTFIGHVELIDEVAKFKKA